MEIYSNGTEAQRTVTLDVPVTPNPGTASVVAKRDGIDLHTFTTPTYLTNGLSVVLPFSLTSQGGDFTLNWKFSFMEDAVPRQYEENTSIQVVTPILSAAEIKSIHSDATPEEIANVEKAVRFIISAYTGQSFTKFIGTRTIRGTNRSTLILPERLLRFTSISGAFTPVVLDQNGWVLKIIMPDVPPVRADYHELHRHSGGVIHNPLNVSWPVWDSSKTFGITGVWGYEEVPAQVKEAAKLLVNDYACGDNIYRDRFLTSMTAADWRIQYNDRAFDGTGNVRADQLLSSFVISRGWAVI